MYSEALFDFESNERDQADLPLHSSQHHHSFVLWNHGCTSQFRLRYVFHLTVFFRENVKVKRYYNERHHDKWSKDGIGGSVKNFVFPTVLSEEAVIQSPEDFVKFSNSNINGISIKFMPLSDILDEPDIVSEKPYVEHMCTLKLHIVKSSKMKATFYYLQFFKIAPDKKLFYTHWYCRPGDITDPCGHFSIPDNCNIKGTGGSCLACRMEKPFQSQFLTYQ